MEIVTPKELEQVIERLAESLTAEISRLVTVSAPQQYFTRPEAAHYIRVSLRSLDSFTATGEIRRAKLGDGQKSAVLYRRRDLDGFIESRLEIDKAEARRSLRAKAVQSSTRS